MNESFNNWLENVPYRLHAEIIKDICRDCDVTKSAVRYWQQGKFRIGKLQRIAINNIAEKYELQKPFNEEYLK